MSLIRVSDDQIATIVTSLEDDCARVHTVREAIGPDDAILESPSSPFLNTVIVHINHIHISVSSNPNTVCTI